MYRVLRALRPSAAEVVEARRLRIPVFRLEKATVALVRMGVLLISNILFLEFITREEEEGEPASPRICLRCTPLSTRCTLPRPTVNNFRHKCRDTLLSINFSNNNLHTMDNSRRTTEIRALMVATRIIRISVGLFPTSIWAIICLSNNSKGRLRQVTSTT